MKVTKAYHKKLLSLLPTSPQDTTIISIVKIMMPIIQ